MSILSNFPRKDRGLGNSQITFYMRKTYSRSQKEFQNGGQDLDLHQAKLRKFLRDVIEISHSADVRRCEQHLDGEQFIVEFLQLYSFKWKTTMKISSIHCTST